MKDAYYFPHDSNARHDPKILALCNTYGLEGYGRFWVLIEMLREADSYRLEREPYVFSALAVQMHCKPNEAQEFVQACIEDFKLLAQNNGYIWSESLNRRMASLDNIRELRRKAARVRWGTSESEVAKSPEADKPSDTPVSVEIPPAKPKAMPASKPEASAVKPVGNYPPWLQILQDFRPFTCPDKWPHEMELAFPDIDLEGSAKHFVDYWSERKRDIKSMKSTWRNWLIKAHEMGKNLKPQKETHGSKRFPATYSSPEEVVAQHLKG